LPQGWRNRTLTPNTPLRQSWAGLGGLGAAGRGRTSSAHNDDKKSLGKPPQKGGARMTAEVAILNKSAVALAADSAVTISIGDKEEKTFDSADKLFELCRHNPIGVMIYNGLSFAEVPLQTIVKQFRSNSTHFTHVKDAGYEFLKYLSDFGRSAPKQIREASIRGLIEPALTGIRTRHANRVNKVIFEAENPPPKPLEKIAELLDESIGFYEAIYVKQKDASFVGGTPEIQPDTLAVIGSAIDERFSSPRITAAQKAKIAEVAKLALLKNVLTDGRTGIVVAGFGSEELFPTLISFEIDAMVEGRLKFVETNHVDIDRTGTRARVLPFAQKEMIDRFMYGMDDGIEGDITEFCRDTITTIGQAILGQIKFKDAASREHFDAQIKKAEQSFVDGLSTKAFVEIRRLSEAALEMMVQFMPKPELAKMAEALVNLTSIKRRVSRGMETVGGPIDVAVISQAEGFVWVKRKHYFPPELNLRYY
jgi:hypothetical protein